jgi:hypothetical protein
MVLPLRMAGAGRDAHGRARSPISVSWFGAKNTASDSQSLWERVHSWLCHSHGFFVVWFVRNLDPGFLDFAAAGCARNDAYGSPPPRTGRDARATHVKGPRTCCPLRHPEKRLCLLSDGGPPYPSSVPALSLLWTGWERSDQGEVDFQRRILRRRDYDSGLCRNRRSALKEFTLALAASALGPSPKLSVKGRGQSGRASRRVSGVTGQSRRA